MTPYFEGILAKLTPQPARCIWLWQLRLYLPLSWEYKAELPECFAVPDICKFGRHLGHEPLAF